MSPDSENLIALNFDKQYLLLIKQKQKNPKRPKRIWMKPCMENRNDRSVCVNILTDKFRHYLGMNGTSYY